MGYNWAGIGGGLGQGISQGMMQAMQPMFDMKALEYKAKQLAKVTTPHWEGLTPEAQQELTGQMLTKLATPKPDPFERMASMMGAMGGAMTGQQQPRVSDAPPAITPTQFPNFQIGNKVKLKNGQIFTLEDEDDILAAQEQGAIIYK